jgi:hypothetical protein
MSEKDFLTYALDTDFTAMTIGEKNSGKTHIALQFIKWALQRSIYHELHLVLPVYKYEQNDSYAWLKSHKNVFVYERLSIATLQKLIKQQEKESSKRIIILIDDATGLTNLDNDELKEIIVTARHIKISLWIIGHGLKMLRPIIRANCDFLFVFYISDTIMKHIWDEKLKRIDGMQKYDLSRTLLINNTEKQGYGLCFQKSKYSQVFNWRINELK